MKSISVTGLILFLFVVCIGPSSAQEFQGNLGLGIYAGPQKLIGGVGDKSMINVWGGLDIFYGLSSKLVLNGSVGAGWNRYADPDNPIKRIEKKPYNFFRTWLFPLNLNLTYYFTEGSFRPYITGGGGAVVWQLRYERWTEEFFSPSGRNVWDTQYNASGNIGAGLVIGLSEKILLDFSGRYYYLYDQELDIIGDGFDPVAVGSDQYAGYKKARPGDSNDGILEFRIGLKVLFGGPKDSDNDGIIDKLDASPNEAEDFDGFQDQDGKPDLDNDKDGVPDIEDKSPNEPEDWDGFQDADGIPDPDNDGDGILDVNDKDPNKPEDFDGFEDEDGKPDLDNDKDGIPDDRDLCPNKPETFNGFEDEDGCPDEVPKKEEPPMEKGVSLIFPGITFESGSAELTAQAKLTLDNVYQMLWENKEVVVEIRGYTDNTGSAATNRTVSQYRAQAVKTYLFHKGIEANRMLAVGFGEDKPIADNSTREGRAKNRRIEFFRIK
jgi:outer membrane protein OmpA-like peptidoglycan-associated protein